MASDMKIIVKNKRALFDYEIIETFEAGIVLSGDEVKSLRRGTVSLDDSFCTIHDGQPRRLQLLRHALQQRAVGPAVVVDALAHELDAEGPALAALVAAHVAAPQRAVGPAAQLPQQLPRLAAAQALGQLQRLSAHFVGDFGRVLRAAHQWQAGQCRRARLLVQCSAG